MTDLASLISKLPEHEQQKLLSQVSAYKEAVEREKAQADFMAFVKMMWPSFIHGRHHALMAKELEAIANGKNKRLIIALPPRHTKSQFASYLFPAWFLGKYPDKKIIQASNTAELAVGFGRNVRNLVGSDIYKKVFPGVDLKSDSKAAGRWSTNHSGEYFACLRRYTLVETQRGLLPASQVKVGDSLLSAGHWAEVLDVYNSEHSKTVNVSGLDCSVDHPIWTMNRGWVFAGDMQPTDVLCVASILDRMKALARRVYGYLEYTNVSSLVSDEVSLHESKKRKVGKLWRARDFCVRKMAGLSKLFGRHGVSTVSCAYVGQDRQRWPVFTRKLSVGDAARAVKQSSIKRSDWGQNTFSARTVAWDNARSDTLSDSEWTRSSQHGKEKKEELRSLGDPEGLGWLRRYAARFFDCSSKNISEEEGRYERHMESARRAAQVILGLLLGVRHAGQVSVRSHEPRHFVNFRTDKDHTFFAENILTHNCGVGGTMTGKGADCLIIDDPHSEAEAKLAQGDPTVFDGVYEWYTSGPRQRLQPNGSIVIVATRWSDKDLTGKVLRNSRHEDEWKVIELPAILPSGNPLWPEFWSLEELLALKEELPPYKWNAQYQQTPTGEAGAIIKREWWKRWERDRPPACEFIIQSWDTAFTKNERSDYSACTTWGVFHLNEDPSDVNIILLDAFKDKWEFPELKKQAFASWQEWQPDAFVVEAKAAGAPLIFELRRMGIPVSEYTPSRGNDKFARLNSVTDLFASGKVWAPDTRWADEVIEEMARFPNAEHDDLLDSAVQGLIRFRQGGFLRLQSDEEDDTIYFRRKKAYY